MLVLAAALSLLVASSPQDPQNAPRADQAPAQSAQTEAEREEERLNEVECRREHVVGSNRRQRVCMTVREWNGIRERSQDGVRGSGSRGELQAPPASRGGF